MHRAFAIAIFFAAVQGAGPAHAGLDSVWLHPDELGGGWDSVAEAPGPVANDPDLQRWGVRARATRHYTRHRDRHVEVCSVEIWVFASEPRARAAHEGFAYPDWVIEREGSLLFMLRSRSFNRGGSSSNDVFAACREIGRRLRTRAARVLVD
jgi:hypothetical protein